MNTPHKRLTTFVFFLLFSLTFPSFLPAFAQTASACAVTEVGKSGETNVALPAECLEGIVGGDGTGVSGECGTVVSQAERISKVLTDSPSLQGGGFDNLTQEVTSKCGKTTPRSEQLGQYWCTFMIIDSYKLAGIPIPKNAAVVAMRKWWKTAKGFKYVDGGSPKGVGPGYSMMMERVAGVHTSDGKQHVALIKKISSNSNPNGLDDKGNGTITTLESNASKREKTYPVKNWQIKNTSYPVRGFGGK